MTIESALKTLEINVRPLRKFLPKRPDQALKVFKIAVKKAYRLKALETHPDRYLEKEEEFKKVGEAQKILKEVRIEDLFEVLPSLNSPSPTSIWSKSKKQEEELPAFKISIEMRGDKAKVTHVGRHGIVTSFVTRCAGYNGSQEWVDKIVKALESSGLIPKHETRIKNYASGFDPVGDFHEDN
jgi:hypothetical protein